MRSLVLFALSFALVAVAAPAHAPQIAPDDVSPSDFPNGTTSHASLSPTAVFADVNLNAAPDGYVPESEATGVPWGSRSCNATSGTPGVDCPFAPAPPDYSCVEGGNGAQFWLAGRMYGCTPGSHCDTALGGACNGVGSPWLSTTGGVGAQQTGPAQASVVTVLQPPIISYVYVTPTPEYPTSLASTTQLSTTTSTPTTEVYTQPSTTSTPPTQGGTIGSDAYPSPTSLSPEESARLSLALLSALGATQTSSVAQATLPGGGEEVEGRLSSLANPSPTSHGNEYETKLSGLRPSASNPSDPRDYKDLLAGLTLPGPSPTGPPADSDPASVRVAKSNLSGMTTLGKPTG